MEIFFVFKKVKIKKAFLKQSENGKLYYQLIVQEKNRSHSNIMIFQNRYSEFDGLFFESDCFYSINGRVINLFGKKQILSVSKIKPLCENEFSSLNLLNERTGVKN